MNQLSVLSQAIKTMSSLELVECINVERSEVAKAAGMSFPSKGHAMLDHSDFLKKTNQVLGVCAGNFSATYQVSGPNGGKRLAFCYRFPKREACLMAMSYSYDLQAKVFDRMSALEAPTTPAAPAVPQSLSAALRLAADQADQIEAQQAQLAITTPKAQALDRLTLADNLLCLTDAAKHLGLEPRRLTSWLSAHDWIYKRAGGKHWIAYQPRLKAGLLDHKLTTVMRADGSEKHTEQVLVTAKGMAKLAEVAP